VAKTCSIEGCDKPAVKTISRIDYEAANLPYSLKPEAKTKVHLCKDHYKEYKKKTKKEKQLKKWRLYMR